MTSTSSLMVIVDHDRHPRDIHSSTSISDTTLVHNSPNPTRGRPRYLGNTGPPSGSEQEKRGTRSASSSPAWSERCLPNHPRSCPATARGRGRCPGNAATKPRTPRPGPYRVAQVHNADAIQHLTDTLDTPFALLELGRVPWQIDVDLRAKRLKVQALAGRVGRHHQPDLVVLPASGWPFAPPSERRCHALIWLRPLPA